MPSIFGCQDPAASLVSCPSLHPPSGPLSYLASFPALPEGQGRGSFLLPAGPLEPVSRKSAAAPLYPGITDLLISLKASYLKKLGPQLPPH